MSDELERNGALPIAYIVVVRGGVSYCCPVYLGLLPDAEEIQQDFARLNEEHSDHASTA